MRRNAIVISLLVCCIALMLVASPAVASAPTTQKELLVACQRIQQSFILPAEASAEQSALVALNIAIAQSQPLDASIDLAEVIRQASTFTTYLVMSDTFYFWNTDHWEGDHRSTYGYSGIRQTSEVEQEYTGTWANLSQTLTTYNGDGTVNSWTQQDWSTDHWVNSSLTTFTYSGGAPVTMTMQTWSGTAWVNFSRSTMTYSGGTLATTTVELWKTSAWVNSMKSTYTYSSGQISEVIMQSWVSSAWVNYMRFTYTYNGSGWEMQNVLYAWQASAWATSSKHDYTHDGSGNEILDLYSIAAGPSWIVMDADTSKWSGSRVTEIVHNHISTVSVSRTQFTYDGNGNNTVELGQDWSGSWENSDRSVYVYQAALAVEVDNGRVPSVFELNQNYPNPFNPVTAIRYSLHRPSQVDIVVFNVLGQEVRTLESGIQSAGTYETGWDGTDQAGGKVASGIYFYRITAGDFTETRKMVLLK